MKVVLHSKWFPRKELSLFNPLRWVCPFWGIRLRSFMKFRVTYQPNRFLVKDDILLFTKDYFHRDWTSVIKMIIYQKNHSEVLNKIWKLVLKLELSFTFTVGYKFVADTFVRSFWWMWFGSYTITLKILHIPYSVKSETSSVSLCNCRVVLNSDINCSGL